MKTVSIRNLRRRALALQRRRAISHRIIIFAHGLSEGDLLTLAGARPVTVRVISLPSPIVAHCSRFGAMA